MKPDIATQKDIEKMISVFYARLLSDRLTGSFFNGVAKAGQERYRFLLCAFWENVLLCTGSYEGNPVAFHRRVHASHPIGKQHVDRWVQLFTGVVDELFDGDKAKLAKQRAASIAKIIFSGITR